MRRPVLVSLVSLNLVCTLALGLFMARSVLAENGSVAAVTVRSAGAQEAVKVVGSTDPLELTSTNVFAPLTSAAITVPAGHTDLITVDFFAESFCSNDLGGATYCRLRLRVGGIELSPAAGTDFIFASPQEVNNFPYSIDAHAMSRFVCLSGGANGTTYRIYLDSFRDVSSTTFTLDDWTLRLTRSHGCATS
jgi:hypothetical protein